MPHFNAKELVVKWYDRLLVGLIRFVLSLRYRVHYKGLEKLTPEKLSRKGGVLFLPNHPTVFVDPTLVVTGLFRQFRPRPLIVEYMYNLPLVRSLMDYIGALPMPSHRAHTNALKKRKSERIFTEIVAGLKRGESFVLYPAGRVKLSNYEQVGGSSAVHTVLQQVPEANVVLVRTTGLYGSLFSSAQTGKSPDFYPTLLQGFKILLKNLIFFTPRRDVTVEFFPMEDFPRDADRLTVNRTLERWYNRPDGLDPALVEQKLPGESLHLVSYSFWKKDYPKIVEKPKEEEVDVEHIPLHVRRQVLAFLSELTNRKAESLNPSMELSTDLGLDSLDAVEILSFLHDEYDIDGVPPTELTTIAKIMGIASGHVQVQRPDEESDIRFRQKAPSDPIRVVKAETIPEMTLGLCHKFGKREVFGDLRSGVLTYRDLKLRALLLADKLMQYPEERIGIMLPASVAVSVVVFACHLAGKTPVMLNWTLGPKHLEHAKDISRLQKVLTSWAFVERLDNVDLTPIEENLLFLEEMRETFTLKDKLRALVRSKRSTKSLKRLLPFAKLCAEDTAVVLFTSGTEAKPKGVPLSHKNVISNLTSALSCLDLRRSDVLLSMLPPFHSFGFTVGTVAGLITGLRVAFHPNPTEGRALANALRRWNVSITCGAPTFLRGMLRAARPADVASFRYCVSGAEAAPPELLKLLDELHIHETYLEGYGITETSPVLTINRPGQPLVGVGKAIPGVELKVVSESTLEPLPQGERGLILAIGPNVFSGYLAPEKREPFVEVEGRKWYNTGDLGYLDERGNLTLSGRLKRFVKIGGEMVGLGGVEETLLESAEKQGWELAPEAPSLCIVALEGQGRPQLILCAIFSVTVREVNAVLKSAGYSNLVRMAEVFQVEEIPLMGTGKIFYRQLEELVKKNRMKDATSL